MDEQQVVLKNIRCGRTHLWEVADEYKDDKEIVLAALSSKSFKAHSGTLYYASPRLKSDREVVMQAVRFCPRSLLFASTELIADRQFILAAVRCNGMVLEFAPEQYKDDKEIVVEALKDKRHQSEQIKFASKRLHLDEEVVLQAVQSKGISSLAASDAVRNIREIVIAAVRENPSMLTKLTEEWKADRDVVLAAVRSRGEGYLLGHAAKALRADREVVLQAVKAGDDVVEPFAYADEELQGDPDFVHQIVEIRGSAVTFASPELKRDRRIALAAVQNDGDAFMCINTSLQEDPDFVLEAVRVCGSVLRFVSDELRGNRWIVLEAVQNDGTALQFASQDLRADADVVFQAVRTFGLALVFASDKLKENHQIVLRAIHNDGRALNYANEELKKDRDLMALAIRSIRSVSHRSSEWRTREIGKIMGNHTSQAMKSIWKAIGRDVHGNLFDLHNFLQAAPNSQAAVCAVRSYADHVWKRSARETIWLVRQALPEGGLAAQQKLILEFADIKNEFYLADRLKRLAPVYVALSEQP